VFEDKATSVAGFTGNTVCVRTRWATTWPTAHLLADRSIMVDRDHPYLWSVLRARSRRSPSSDTKLERYHCFTGNTVWDSSSQPIFSLET